MQGRQVILMVYKPTQLSEAGGHILAIQDRMQVKMRGEDLNTTWQQCSARRPSGVRASKNIWHTTKGCQRTTATEATASWSVRFDGTSSSNDTFAPDPKGCMGASKGAFAAAAEVKQGI